mgnify:CR=1 FL=1
MNPARVAAALAVGHEGREFGGRDLHVHAPVHQPLPRTDRIIRTGHEVENAVAAGVAHRADADFQRGRFIERGFWQAAAPQDVTGIVELHLGEQGLAAERGVAVGADHQIKRLPVAVGEIERHGAGFRLGQRHHLLPPSFGHKP